ncbi:MAG: hypothetical protein JWQ71_3723 [Pedosphaera sp.]|nr:hypothetical protein [Pedosphaera sp.]
MNPKNTWFLIVLAAGLFAFIFFFERHTGKPQSEVLKVLPELKIGSVTSIQIQPAGQLPIRAERTNGNWQLVTPIAYAAQGVAIENLLRALVELMPQSRISAQELRGQSKVDEKFGLDAPQATILVQQGEERRQIKLGALTPGNQVYLQVIGNDGIDVVSADLFKLLPRTANEWRDTSFVNLKELTFNQLTVVDSSKTLELQRDATNKIWRMTRPMVTRANNNKIEDSLFKLQNLRVNRFVTDEPKADLEAFGLQPPALQLTLAQGTNSVLSIQFGKSPTNDDGQVYARVSGQHAIVLVPKQELGTWSEQQEAFRDRRLAGLYSGALDIIEVRGAEKFILQRQTNDTWQVMGATNLLADADLVREFIEGLSTLEIVPVKGEFAVKGVVTESELPKYGLATPVQQFILKRNTLIASNATNLVIAELDFGSTNEDKIYARRADESSVYAVKLSDFQRLPIRAVQFRDRHIWNFKEEEVSRITVRQNGKSLDMVHKGPYEWGVAPGSQGLIKNAGAVEAAAADLGELEAESWVEQGNQNRARYGFNEKSPKISVVVNREGKAYTLNLELGGWSPRPCRYAEVQLDGQYWIFEFPAKFLDRVLYGLDIEKVAP